ncbi:MAG: LicD family protein [Bacteroidales bacterium]|nr:LicD family protein [Bacteroidales bacterium]MDY6002565.1 LicD family protein [Candidatus Cryptobacteroides sp.]
MRQLTLKELQSFSLGILKDVAEFCEKNGIRYSLGYGTMLGAVRHKGFIPWDDDVDLMMPREDYERFRSSYRSDKYTFIDSRNTPDCYIAFGRVCDTEKTIATSCIPWIKKDVGVWIDIFPVDRVPDDKETFERIYDALLILLKSNVGIRRVHAIASTRFSIYKRLKIWVLKKINPRLAKRDPNAIVKDMNALISLLSPRQSQHWSQLCCPDVGTNEFFRDKDINEYISLRFEDRDFFAWKGYDRILRDSYGDYMILPPENKRKPLQNYIKFTWKE